MASVEVAEREEAKVPALVHAPVLDITAEDIALPRIYIGQYMSEHVKRQLVPFGAIFAASGQDDPDPAVLAELGDKDGIIVHVLGMWKGKSRSKDGELELYDYNDPAAPDDAWITYNYTVCLPEIDQDVPYKWLLSRTGRPAAKNINTVLAKNSDKGPCWNNAFRFTTAQRKNVKGEYAIACIAPVDSVKENVVVAEALGILVSGSQAEYNSTGEEPAI